MVACPSSDESLRFYGLGTGVIKLDFRRPFAGGPSMG